MIQQDVLPLVWMAYIAAGRPVVIRNRLATHYLPLVELHARSVALRLPRSVELDDLKSMGYPGLLDAIERFDPAMKTRFETYSAPRIRGAIMDGLREMDEASRTVRAAVTELDAAADRLRLHLGRDATPEEIADHLRLTPYQYAQYDAHRRALRPCSLSGDRTSPDAPVSAAVVRSETIRDDRHEDPARAALRRRTRELIEEGLDRSERLVIILYYFEGMSLAEIGDVLGLSESRVSQMKTSILARLKARLAPQDLEVA